MKCNANGFFRFPEGEFMETNYIIYFDIAAIVIVTAPVGFDKVKVPVLLAHV